jgi:hypothetical protein
MSPPPVFQLMGRKEKFAGEKKVIKIGWFQKSVSESRTPIEWKSVIEAGKLNHIAYVRPSHRFSQNKKYMSLSKTLFSQVDRKIKKKKNKQSFFDTIEIQLLKCRMSRT